MKPDIIAAKDAHKTDSGETKTLDCKESYGIFTIKITPGDDPNLDPPEHKLFSMCQKIKPPEKKKPERG